MSKELKTSKPSVVMTPAELEPLAAINFALDHVHGVTECYMFLDDWREGDLSEWPEYRTYAALWARGAR